LPQVGGDKYLVKVAKKGQRGSASSTDTFETWRKLYYSVFYMGNDSLNLFNGLEADFKAAFADGFIELENMQKVAASTVLARADLTIDPAFGRPRFYYLGGPSVPGSMFDLKPTGSGTLDHKPFHLAILVVPDGYECEEVVRDFDITAVAGSTTVNFMLVDDHTDPKSFVRSATVSWMGHGSAPGTGAAVGAAAGGLLGAAIGAGVGLAKHEKPEDIAKAALIGGAVGAAVGAGAGAIVGALIRKHEDVRPYLSLVGTPRRRRSEYRWDLSAVPGLTTHLATAGNTAHLEVSLAKEGSGFCGYSIGNLCVVRTVDGLTSVLQTFTHEVGHGIKQAVKEERKYDAAGAEVAPPEKHPTWHTDNFGGQGPHCSIRAQLRTAAPLPDGLTAVFEYGGAGKLCTMFFADEPNVEPKGKFCENCTPRVKRVGLDEASMRRKWNLIG
jgi:hypothetical protein